jgi:hypothetical protein
MKASLRDLLLSGNLGGLRLGMTEPAAIAALGARPDRTLADPREGRRATWKCGSLEFFFSAIGPSPLRLVLIFTDDYHDLGRLIRRGGGLTLDPWILVPGLTLRRFLDELQRIGAMHATVPGPAYGWTIARTVILDRTGVRVAFRSERYWDLENGEKAKLHPGQRAEFRISSISAVR